MLASLKKRRRGIYRTIPVPSAFLDTLDLVHGIREVQSHADAGRRHRWRRDRRATLVYLWLLLKKLGWLLGLAAWLWQIIEWLRDILRFDFQRP